MESITVPVSGYVYRRTTGDLVGDFLQETRKEVFLTFVVTVWKKPYLYATVDWFSEGDFPHLISLNLNRETLAIREVSPYLKNLRKHFERMGWSMMVGEYGTKVYYKPLNPYRDQGDEFDRLVYKKPFSREFLEDLLYLM